LTNVHAPKHAGIGDRAVGVDGDGTGDDPGGATGEGGHETVTENERRAQDLLSTRDLLLRALSAVGLIAVALLVLLAA